MLFGLGSGLSESRWFSKHEAHHRAPNHVGHDPDVDIPFVFSHEHALSRSPFYQKYVFPYQHMLFWMGIWFVYPRNVFSSMKYLFVHINLRSVIEVILMTIHFVILFGFIFWFLPPITALGFITVLFLVMGMYMAIVFAANHKGEKMIGPTELYNWTYQISLTRNITPSTFVSFIFGGLEYQIEHHLFPSVSRFKYGRAQVLVKQFCHEKGIRYHETSWLKSMREIHVSLQEEAQKWRT